METKFVHDHPIAGFYVVDPETGGYKHTTHTFFDHEPMLSAWGKAIKEGDIAIDVGACFGSFTLPALALGATVIAVEPSTDGFEILEANVGVNGWQGRCQVVRSVLFDGTPYPQALLQEVFGHHYPGKDFVFETLDGLVARLELKRVDHVKLDVEGAELGVLEGGHATLERWHPALYIEDHDGINSNPDCVVSSYPASIRSSERIHEMLQGLGYNIEVMPHSCSRKFIVARR